MKAQLIKEIESYIGGLDPNSIRFEFTAEAGHAKLDIITRNPRHAQEFLFHSEMGLDEMDALRKMLEYVKHYKDKESSYTIQWSLADSGVLQTSYFSARNILHALDKFYFGREINSVVVFSVKLNPIS